MDRTKLQSVYTRAVSLVMLGHEQAAGLEDKHKDLHSTLSEIGNVLVTLCAEVSAMLAEEEHRNNRIKELEFAMRLIRESLRDNMLFLETDEARMVFLALDSVVHSVDH